ncbi:MAG: ABC transporter ATP-binding protein, partial [Kiritimatiellae bacterium]|nr:ABC transporter ATP-binding protein [Kiritimatiellia bacterium]
RSGKLSYNEKRELDALPGRIEALEGELAGIRDALSDGSIYRTDPARAKALGERLPCAERELESAVDRWAELAERGGM